MAEGNGTQRDLGYLEAAVESLEKRFDRFEEKHDKANAEILEAINQAKGSARIVWPMITGALGGGLAIIAQYLGFVKH